MENQFIKKTYSEPVVEIIKLDNHISLQLESTPPFVPGEELGYNKECNCNTPFIV